MIDNILSSITPKFVASILMFYIASALLTCVIFRRINADWKIALLRKKCDFDTMGVAEFS